MNCAPTISMFKRLTIPGQLAGFDFRFHPLAEFFHHRIRLFLDKGVSQSSKFSEHGNTRFEIDLRLGFAQSLQRDIHRLPHAAGFEILPLHEYPERLSWIENLDVSKGFKAQADRAHAVNEIELIFLPFFERLHPLATGNTPGHPLDIPKKTPDLFRR